MSDGDAILRAILEDQSDDAARLAGSLPVSDHDAILRAILETPFDDAPRLALADLVDELGDHPRAHFIRLSCELARTKHNHRQGKGGPCRACQIKMQLQQQNCRDAAKGIRWVFARSWIPPGGFSVADHSAQQALDLGRAHGRFIRQLYDDSTLARGFVATIRCESDMFVQYAGALFAAQPITFVHLTDRAPYSDQWYGDSGANVEPYGSPPNSRLPTELARGRVYLHHASMEMAFAALSDACVDYGREKAGLSPLVEKSPKKILT